VGDPAPFEGLLQDRVGHVLGGAGGDGRLDQNEAVRGDLLADDLEALLQGGDLGGNRGTRCGIVSPYSHDDHVGEAEGVVGVGSGEGLLLQDDNDLMALGAMIGGEGLEALEFSGFILLRAVTSHIKLTEGGIFLSRCFV